MTSVTTSTATNAVRAELLSIRPEAGPVGGQVQPGGRLLISDPRTRRRSLVAADTLADLLLAQHSAPRRPHRRGRPRCGRAAAGRADGARLAGPNRPA
ncbi:hypothetical protein [Dactylosporangium fulvum]|uniref:hypothetical protein n=1 Tax=Dactylosporangium fulvum TaxID=53359 RepID=UPI0031CF7D29